MPNWCESDLTVKGDPAMLRNFQTIASGPAPEWPDESEVDNEKKSLAEQVLDKLDTKKEVNNVLETNQFIPIPQAVLDKGFDKAGYKWCAKNWGTKWGICDSYLKTTGHRHLKFEFKTAWCPPLPVILAMSERFPDLTFDLRYYEGGSGFKGRFVVTEGEVQLQKEEDYHGQRGG